MASPTGTSAAAQIQALLSPLLNAQAQQRQQAQTSTKNIIDYLRGSAAPIGRDYQGGINQQNAFARQYAGFQQAANPDAAIQRDLRAIHAPAAQAAQIGGELHNAYGRAAADLYNAGGAIPNSAFASDKAGALAFAHSLPSIEGLQAQQLFAKLLAGQASDRSSAESSLASQLAKSQSTADTAAAKPPTTRSFKDGTTRQYNPATGKWDVVARAAGGASGGISPSAVSTTTQRATKAGDAALGNLTDKVWAKTGNPPPTIKVDDGSGKMITVDNPAYLRATAWYQAQLPKSFGSAMYRVITAIGPHLKAIGYSHDRIRREALAIVSAEFDPPPGSKWAMATKATSRGK